MNNQTPSHHIAPDVLMAYAAGSLDEAHSVLVATHLALCPTCREAASGYEALGGALVDAMPETAVEEEALQSVFAMIDAAPDEASLETDCRNHSEEMTKIFPAPLREYLPGDWSQFQWKSRGLSVKEAVFDIGNGETKASLLWIKPGASVPSHTHSETETTLVLKGAFDDQTGHYGRGDVAVATPDVNHSPTASDGEECICFAVVSGHLELTGTVGRFFNPFIKI